jgi:hypothetical protein
MKENVMLLQEINVLRKDVHELNKKLRLIKFIGGGQGAADNNSTQRSGHDMSGQKEPMSEI